MRFKFDPESVYAGRLESVSKRPIENELAAATLVRLEFLIFRISDGRLSTRGLVASRDIILWPMMEEDAGVFRMAKALCIEDAYSGAEWLAAADRRRWITIRFGNPSPADQRQPFVKIQGFAPETKGFRIETAPHKTNVRWATVQAAASELGVSSSTVRRLIDCREEEFGESLVRRTSGRHRRINLPLLRLLTGNSA
jgi:hypothetical protein